MLNRNAAALLVGCAALCAVIAAYSVGRINGMEAGLRAVPQPVASAAAPEPAQTPREVERELLLHDTQVIARALLMYAQDHDEVFPPAGNLLTTIKRVKPYAERAGAWDSEGVFLASRDRGGSFYYTFDSRSFATIANPAEVRIGYKDGPDGRAWAFADGHTSWEPRLSSTP